MTAKGTKTRKAQPRRGPTSPAARPKRRGAKKDGRVVGDQGLRIDAGQKDGSGEPGDSAVGEQGRQPGVGDEQEGRAAGLNKRRRLKDGMERGVREGRSRQCGEAHEQGPVACVGGEKSFGPPAGPDGGQIVCGQLGDRGGDDHDS